MEFDLPKRDILINEAMNGALAMTKDFGALVTDPNFLVVVEAPAAASRPARSRRGPAAASTRSATSSPACPVPNDEKLFSQQGAGRTQFGSGDGGPDPRPGRLQVRDGHRLRDPAGDPARRPVGRLPLQLHVHDERPRAGPRRREAPRAGEAALHRHRRAARQLRAARGQPLPGGVEGVEDEPGRAAASRTSRASASCSARCRARSRRSRRTSCWPRARSSRRSST